MRRDDFLTWIGQNKATSVLFGLAFAWLLVRHSVAASVCGSQAACWLYPDSWPGLLGVNAASSPWLVGLLAASLFALPVGRSGLLATLVGIHLAEPVFGLAGVVALFVAASAISIVLVQAVVEYGLRHPGAALIHVRLRPIDSLFGPSIRKNGLVWISVGNLVGSQWQIGALGALAHVRRRTIWLGLMLGNLAGFVLVYAFSQVPDLDALSVVLLVLLLAFAASSPALWANLKARRTLPGPEPKTDARGPQHGPFAAKTSDAVRAGSGLHR